MKTDSKRSTKQEYATELSPSGLDGVMIPKVANFQSKRINAIDWVIHDEPMKCAPTLLSDRVPTQPSSRGRIVITACRTNFGKIADNEG